MFSVLKFIRGGVCRRQIPLQHCDTTKYITEEQDPIHRACQAMAHHRKCSRTGLFKEVQTCHHSLIIALSTVPCTRKKDTESSQREIEKERHLRKFGSFYLFLEAYVKEMLK